MFKNWSGDNRPLLYIKQQNTDLLAPSIFGTNVVLDVDPHVGMLEGVDSNHCGIPTWGESGSTHSCPSL